MDTNIFIYDYDQDIKIDTAEPKLTQKEIEQLKKYLSKAKPYTEEEVDNIPFDSCDYDIERLQAYMAQKTLREAGLL